MRQFVTRNFAGCVALVASALFLAVPARQALAQKFQRAIAAPATTPAPAGAAEKGAKKAKEADEAADKMQDLAEKSFPGGAALKTDPEQQRLLKRAEQCVADGRLDLAAVLWQKVLDEAGDTLMTRDGRTYTSLAEEVERMLSTADPLALKTYRINADGEAQAVLAKAAPDKEEEALSTVVRRYFLSSAGDESAYKLGCYALDRHDFVGASRLFAKILERHPDPTVPRGEILLRLAVAAAHVGDGATAKAALEAIPQMPGPKPTNDIIEQVDQDATEAAKTATLVSAASQNWHMSLGNPSRSGRMKGLPVDATSKTLSELWTQEFSLLLETVMNQNGMPGPGMAMRVRVLGGRQQNQQPQAVSREQLISQWKQNKWNPTSQLLFDSGKVYIKTNEDIACYNVGANSDKPVWRSVWLNQYQMDSMSSHLIGMAQVYNQQMAASSRPRTLPEVLLFGDKIHQAMSISGGTIYSIEGKRVSKETGPAPTSAQPARGFQYNVQPRRSRSNFLAAYEAASGKAKWHRSASDEDKEGSQDVGFLAAPVPYGSLLLVPITDGGTIWLYGLDSKDGSTVWKAYLCDEPAGGCNPWSPVGISIDGRDAYILCGTGVVFAVDAVSGAIRWAVRYKREQKPNMTMRNYNMTMMDVEGWDDDVVIPYGKTLVVMASDSNEMIWLDRRTGAFGNGLSPRISPFGQAANYVLGTKGPSLFVAGRNIVRRYDIPSSKLIWEREIEDSLGRGVLTEDALYIPVKNSVLKLDPDNKGRELSQVGVQLTTEDPVGNLFSDGEKLWVAGAGRVYAMTNLEHRMALLQEKISAGDGEAQLNRMRLYAKEKKFEEMLVDLRGSYQLFKASLTPDQSADKFFSALAELKLSQDNPSLVLELLAEEFVTAASLPPLGKEIVARRNDLLSSSLSVIRQKKLKGLTAQVLGIAPLLEPEYLQHAAAQTLDATYRGEEDLAALKVAAGGSVLAQLISVGPLSKAAPQDVKDSLAKFLESKDDRLKLSAARALTNAGERSTLPVFLKLLESENPRVRVRAHQSLRSLSGQQITFSSDGKPEERVKAVGAWKAWIEKDGQTAKLTLPLSETDVPLGRTLITSHVHSLIIELDANHKERWRMQIANGNPWGCQGLPNGNRLISVTSQLAVIEYNEEGKEVWKKDRLPSSPWGVQRLANGNTLIACADSNQILEVSPDGTSTSIPLAGRPMSAQRLENGNTLVALQTSNKVVEVDKANKVVWEARNMNGPCSATRLENGNTLIVQMYTGQVVEVDAAGKTTVWTAQIPLVSPCNAQRLPNGNTLIADNNGVHEVDPTGKEIRWQHKQNNSSSVSQF
ncbi:MAG: PQQ-binding-like beta-propeller repeat protein [Pirellulaceae bacterium]